MSFLLPFETAVIARRVAQGFDGEVLPIEAYTGTVLVTGAYEGDDLDEAQKLVREGCDRLAYMARNEVPW